MSTPPEAPAVRPARRIPWQTLTPLLGLVVLVIVGALMNPAFLSSTNIFNVLTRSSFIGIIAVGSTFVIVAGGIDLSVGSMAAFVAGAMILVMNALLGTEFQMNLPAGEYVSWSVEAEYACSGATVLGVAGSAALIGRANHNAAVNGLADRTTFVVADLFKVTEAQWQDWGRFDKLLIDPPRDGAMELVKVIGAEGPRRIVYVSCNPATLARDAAVLTAVQGYRLRAAGVVNMFPHTAHVESMALFERD